MSIINNKINQHRQYYSLVKQRDFVTAFACLPQSQWTSTSKRRWMCTRLGLYQPLLEAGLKGQYNYSLQSAVSYMQALSAYGQLEACQRLLDKWIKHPFFYRFQNELINEFAKYNPQLALQLIERIPVHTQSIYHQALRLSFRQLLGLFDSQDQEILQQLCQEHQENNPELLLLKNNCQSTLSSKDRLYLLNRYQRWYDLPDYQLLNSSKTITTNSVTTNSVTTNSVTTNSVTTNSVASNTFDSRGLTVDSILPHHPLSMTEDNQYKVTILVTMYNSAEYIQSTLHSLLNQTWHNIEVIVVDDVSMDNSVELVKKMAQQDNRLKILCQTNNTGTFIAKSKGLVHATGDFVICHDSDDWAHPLKIEQQVLPLFYDKQLQGTTSDWIKLSNNGSFMVRQGYPFKRKNPASLMFRRLTALKKMADGSGILWEQVRTGADSEFFERFKLYFGKDGIQHIPKPLTIGAHRHDSLMNDKATGTQNLDARIHRLQYWEDWRIRHVEKIRSCKVLQRKLHE